MTTGQNLIGYNMFSYCLNSPISRIDENGNCSHTAHAPWLGDCAECSIVTYDVPLYKQGVYSLCWAYCHLMIESYREGTNYTQYEATRWAKKLAIEKYGYSNWNKGSWPSNKGSVYKIKSIEHLFDILKENGPVYAYYSDFDASGNVTKAHLVVVTGVNLYENTVYTNNPWGVSGVQSYEDFLDDVAWDQQYDSGMSMRTIYLVK